MAKATKFDRTPEHLESLRKQYETYVDLFKFYLDLILKATVWYYTITGAILSFHFSDKNPQAATTIHAVLLPALFSVVLFLIFFGASTLAVKMQNELDRIRDDLGLEGAPHVQVLIWSTRLFGLTYIIVGAVLFAYWLSVVTK